ncbi:MAG: glycosyltransferase family 2 protein [Anaerolineaceae bacterium]|nr:glycosyltransferase family 2 protein [Anaerolineales bacterium]MEB2334287.1 glycosyltransferase family 2 protein [Anaerolineaceae bacterium]
MKFISMFVAVFFWLSVFIIIYTYIGYPLLIALLAKFRRKPKPYPAYLPSATLLIAAYNEETVIENKIRNSLEIEYPEEKLQILFVTDGSTDATPQIVKRFETQGIELLHEPQRNGKMAAINRAMLRVRGEIIIFSDANNYYQPNTLKELVAPFQDPSIGAASGAKLIASGDGNLGASEGLYWKYESYIKKQESRLGSCTSVAGEILAIRKTAYLKPPDNVINDDFYLGMQVIRQGLRLVYVPQAKSIERVSLTAQDEIKRRTRINAGRYQIIANAGKILPLKHPLLVWQIVSHKFLRLLVPFGMICALLTNIVAVILSTESHFFLLSAPFNMIILDLQLLFYGLAAIGAIFPKLGEKHKLMRLFYLPAFLTNSNLAALYGFLHHQRRRQSHLWERIQRR